MRAIRFLIGIILVIYVIWGWISGTLQYSMEGETGSVIFDIADFFSPQFMMRSLFLGVVYALTFVLGIILVWSSLGGGSEK